MEKLSPQVELIWHLKFNIERNQSISAGLNSFKENKNCAFSREISALYLAHQQGTQYNCESILSQLSLSCLSTIQRGLRGESITNALAELEREAIEDCLEQVDEFTKKLPYLLMLPLFVFLFPALAALMTVPLLMNLMQF